MSWVSPRFLVEPVYRWIYGRPLTKPLPDAGGSPASSGPGGLVLVADGVGGFDLCATALRYVAAAEGLPHTVEVFSWSHGPGRWYADLTRSAHRDLKAAELAERVREFRNRSPLAPVFLVAKSGGSGVVVKALERLDEAVVERSILLAPALAPDYDLSRALQAVRSDLVVFWSPLDLIVLGAGTWIFGTADRVRTASAGLLGFRTPNLADAAQTHPYRRLRQVRWSLPMASTGYLGGHLGPDSPIFLRKYVVPLLREPTLGNA